MFSYKNVIKNTIVMKAHIDVEHLNVHITALIVSAQSLFFMISELNMSQT